MTTEPEDSESADDLNIAHTDSVNTENEYALMTGQNLPNHTMTAQGKGRFVKVGFPAVPVFRTRQQVYRFCAYALSLADVLPDEPGEHDFETVLEAVENA